jgi:hypothetical protein
MMDEEVKVQSAANLSRRGFLVNAGKIAVAATAGAAGLSVLASQSTEAADAPAWPWPYKKLDPEKVYWKAAGFYYQYGCSQAAFEAIISELGQPFTSVPTGMMRFGEGGVSGWGSHCGALLGASAAIGLVHKDSAVYSKLITQMTGWYTEVLGSGSVLCHVSVTEWAKANGVTVESQERKDRCSRVAGEVAKKAVLLLNAQADNALEVTFGPRESVVGCLSCHGANGMMNVRAGVLQDCTSCHTDEPHKQQQ